MWGLWWTKQHWGRFSPSTSVSPANHSTSFSIITITRVWHSRPRPRCRVDPIGLHPPLYQLKKIILRQPATLPPAPSPNLEIPELSPGFSYHSNSSQWLNYISPLTNSLTHSLSHQRVTLHFTQFSWLTEIPLTVLIITSWHGQHRKHRYSFAVSNCCGNTLFFAYLLISRSLSSNVYTCRNIFYKYLWLKQGRMLQVCRRKYSTTYSRQNSIKWTRKKTQLLCFCFHL
jgi:hypothetical protein